MTVAPPPDAAPAPGSDLTAARYRLFGLVRDVRVEAQHLVRAPSLVRSALELVDPVARAAELQAALPDTWAVFRESRAEVDARLSGRRQLVEDHPRVYDEAGDAIAHAGAGAVVEQQVARLYVPPTAAPVQPEAVEAASEPGDGARPADTGTAGIGVPILPDD